MKQSEPFFIQGILKLDPPAADRDSKSIQTPDHNFSAPERVAIPNTDLLTEHSTVKEELPSELKAPSVSARSGKKSKEVLVDRFSVLLGRTPTAQEQSELFRIKEALDLSNDDALWLIIMALQYERDELVAALDERLDNAKRQIDETIRTADAIVDSAKARFMAVFPAELTKIAEKVIPEKKEQKNFNFPTLIIGLLVLFSISILGMGSAAYIGYREGEMAGFNRCLLLTKSPVSPPAKGR